MKTIIDIDKKWFEENKTKFLECYNSDKFTDNKNSVFRIEVEAENSAILISEDQKIRINSGTNECYVACITEPDVESLINLSQVISKYFNKAKTVFEALK